MEKIIKPVSGFLVLILSLAGIGLGIYLIVSAIQAEDVNLLLIWTGIVLLLLSVFISFGGLPLSTLTRPGSVLSLGNMQEL